MSSPCKLYLYFCISKCYIDSQVLVFRFESILTKVFRLVGFPIYTTRETIAPASLIQGHVALKQVIWSSQVCATSVTCFIAKIGQFHCSFIGFVKANSFVI